MEVIDNIYQKLDVNELNEFTLRVYLDLQNHLPEILKSVQWMDASKTGLMDYLLHNIK